MLEKGATVSDLPNCDGIENRMKGGAGGAEICRKQGLGVALWEMGSRAFSL